MDTDQLSTLTSLAIQGKPSREIAAQIGVSHTTVSNTLNKPDIKSKVERCISDLINRGLKPSVRTLSRFAAIGNTKDITLPDNRDLAKLSLDASKAILNHVSNAGPQTIINTLIYQSDAHGQLSSDSLAMIDRALGISQGLQADEDIIDLSCHDQAQDSK